MCGISGYFSRTGVPVDSFMRAHLTMRRRGPDDEGYVAGDWDGSAPIECHGPHTDPACAPRPTLGNYAKSRQRPPRWVLGHWRLSIVDLSPAGHQPMFDAEGRYVVAFNGEIFNYIELRRELTDLGRSFKTETDTEVVLQAYAQWGEDAFRRFNGMWALAICDLRRQTVTLSRDRFGIKPLYYRVLGDGICFASEFKFFRRFGSLRQNDLAAAEFLAFSWSDHRQETFYQDVMQLPPASSIEFSASGEEMRTKTYWQFPDPEAQSDPGAAGESAVETLQHLLDDAIRLRLRSDVPLGCFLSGGLDSNVIVGNVLRRQKEAGRLEVFSSIYAEEAFSERRYIERTLALYPQLSPHYVTLTADALLSALHEFVECQEVPVRSMAVFAQWSLFRAVREESDITVILTGQGADELFGGYSWHYVPLAAQLMMSGELSSAWRELRVVSGMRQWRPGKLLRQAAGLAGKYVLGGRRLGSQRLRNPHVDFGFRVPVPVFSGRRPLDDTLRRGVAFSPIPEYLRYEDRNSMWFSLESRVPFLDFPLVDWAAQLPVAAKIRDGVNKRVLRQAAAATVAPEILDRKDKMGFVTPQRQWMQERFQELLAEAVAGVRVPFVGERDLQARYRADLARPRPDFDFWWRVINLYLWQQRL